MTELRFLSNPEKVGGNALLIEDGGSRVVLDCGLEDQALYPPTFFAAKPLDYLIRFGGIPRVPDDVDAVAITHGHSDHYCGLFAQPESHTVYGTEFTLRNIQWAHEWRWDSSYFHLAHSLNFLDGDLDIGDIHLTPIPVSHSTVEARAFLVETPGASILYTGDFRLGGFMRTDFGGIKDLDVLVLDSTNLQNRDSGIREADVVEKIGDSIRSQEGITIVLTSTSNLRRTRSIIDVVRRLGRRVTATPDILRKYGYGIGTYDFPDVDGVAPDDSGEEDVILTGYLHSWYPQDVFMSLHHLLDESAKVIMSLNTGISELEYIKYGMFKHTAGRLGASVEEIHASGHAYHDELVEVIEQLSPRLTLPVHTLGAPVKEVRALHGTIRFPVPRRIKF